MRNELDTLDKKVTELVLLNINLRKLNKRLQKDLTEKNSECQRLQKKIALSITSLKEIRQKFNNCWMISKSNNKTILDYDKIPKNKFIRINVPISTNDIGYNTPPPP